MSNKRQDSIRKLDGADRIRERTESMLGSKGIEGARQTFIEIIGNSLDELRKGNGTRIEVSIDENNSMVVRDFGSGAPMGWNEQAKDWNWRLVFNELYASGKYDADKDILSSIKDWNNVSVEDVRSIFKIGMNGVGASCSCYTAETFEVISYYGGKAHRMLFERGIPVLPELEVTNSNEPQGTYIKWKPDDTIFTDVNIGEEWLYNFCKNISFVAEAEIHFKGYSKEEIFPKRTIDQVLFEETGNKVGYKENLFAKEQLINAKGDKKVIVSYVKAAITNGEKEPRFFINMIPVKRGSHEQGVDEALMAFIKGLRLGLKVTPLDIHGKINIILSTFSNSTTLRGQTKDEMEDEGMFEAVFNTVLQILNNAYVSKEKWVLDVVKSVEDTISIRQAVEEQKKKVKEIVKTTKSKELPSKFVASSNYLEGKGHSVLIIIEGDSALNSTKMARDQKTQSIYPTKGKGLSVWKSTVDDILENKEIKEQIAILGAGVDIEMPGEKFFDINKLKFDEIWFLSDADIDGSHINMLLLTQYLKLFPQVVKEGKVYVVKSPLYRATSRGTTKYYFSQDAFDADNKLGLVSNVKRFKGLGSLNPDTLWDTTLSGNYENRIQVKLDPNDPDVNATLESLFGTDTALRKDPVLKKILGEDGYSSLDSILAYQEDLISSSDVNNDHLINEDVIY